MADQNLARDVQLLTYILKNQSKIQKVIKDFKCDFSNTSKSVANNEYAFDLCAMYMAQIGENTKLLSVETKEELGKVIDINILRYFRNMIDHAYEKVNKQYLQAYIENMISPKVVKVLKERYLYCIQNKGNKE